MSFNLRLYHDPVLKLSDLDGFSSGVLDRLHKHQHVDMLQVRVRLHALHLKVFGDHLVELIAEFNIHRLLKIGSQVRLSTEEKKTEVRFT